MKSERRHELMENELAKDLDKASEFVKAYWQWLVGGLAGLVAVIAIVVFSLNHATVSRQRQWADYTALSAAGGSQAVRQELASLADRAGSDALEAWTTLRLGQAAYEELVLNWHELDENARQQLRRQASEAYQAVLASHADNVLAVATARVGLGVLAETMGEYDLAAEEYGKAAEMPQAEARPMALVANRNLDQLRALREPVTLADKPTEPEPTPPATEPAG